MSVWDDLVGQDELIARLKVAVDAAGEVLAGGHASAMTHAWLFTGPPGSGRSNAARAFAAALHCENAGCGECLACRTVVAGSHADVAQIRTEKATIGVDIARELVRRAALAPAGRRWQILIIEDADRLTERAADALLKGLEEPPPRTVWLLCAPTVEDVVPTIRSRCRAVVLRTPPTESVAAHLMRRDGVDEPIAIFAARASQGHIGRARGLALDEATRNRRREVLRVPSQLVDLGSCMTIAQNLVDAAKEEADPRREDLDAKELADLEMAFGAGTKGVRTTGLATARKSLEDEQRLRSRRLVRDALDRSLLDLASYYRDVVALQLDTTGALVNEEMRAEIASTARNTTGEVSIGRLDAIFEAREMLEGEVAPVLALESLMISLHGGNQR